MIPVRVTILTEVSRMKNRELLRSLLALMVVVSVVRRLKQHGRSRADAHSRFGARYRRKRQPEIV